MYRVTVIVLCYVLYTQWTNLWIKKIHKYELPNLLILENEINFKTAMNFIAEINKLKNEEIYIYIDSHGGDIVSGYLIISEILDRENNITCIAKKAESISFDIFSFCKTRYVMKDSTLFQHEAVYIFQGTGYELSIYYESSQYIHLLDSIVNRKNSVLMNITFDEYMTKLKQGFTINSGSEIVKYGLADEVII